MSEEIQPKGYKENPDLLPIPASKRLYGTPTFVWMMFSMNTCIPMFFLGPIGYSLGLDAFEVALGAFLGNFIAMVVLMLNGWVGVKYGISYPVQLRPSWGFNGSKIAVFLRGCIGIGWYGIEAYNGSLAILMVLLYILGYHGRDPNAIALFSFKYVVLIVIPYVIGATIVMMKGLTAIAKVVNFGGPIMFFYFVWLFLYLRGVSGPTANMPEGVGVFSKPFAIYLAVQTNWWAPMCLNISDLTRGIHHGKRGLVAVITGPIVGIVLGQIAGSLLGYYLVIYTGYVTPQEIILYTAPGAITIILGQLFAFIGPFSTDVTANIPPIMDLLMSIFKLRSKSAAIVAGIIAFFAAPWWAVEKGPDIVNYVTIFSSNYGIILGPIAGIMLADHYFIKKRKYDLQKLYTYGPEGYWYHKGINIAGILSYVITIIMTYIISILLKDLPRVGPIVFPTNLSWYPGIILAFIFHVIFSKIIYKE